MKLWYLGVINNLINENLTLFEVVGITNERIAGTKELSRRSKYYKFVGNRNRVFHLVRTAIKDDGISKTRKRTFRYFS